MLMGQENPHGGDVYRNRVRYDFSSNITPLGTPQAVIDAVQASCARLSDYPDPYCTALREGLSAALNVPARHIMCGNGAAELIFLFAAALRPKRALIVTPTFCEYENALRAVGCELSFLPLRAQDGFMLPDDACIDLSGVDIVVLCNPNNPTGRAYPRAQVARLAERCAQQGAHLLLDECFCDLTDSPEQHSLLPDTARLPNVFLLRAFTKSYGMAGVRLGFAICADEALLAAMCRCGQTWNVSSPAQAAGLAALDCKDFAARGRAVIQAERAFLSERLARLGCAVYPAYANFILFQSAIALYEPLLKRGILIRRCANFRGLDDSYYRCAVRPHEENLALIGAMEEIIHG